MPETVDALETATLSVSDVITAAAAVFALIALVVSIMAYRRDAKPVVIAYLKSNNEINDLSLYVENRGNGIAYDIEILDWDDSLVHEDMKQLVSSSFVTRGIPMLTPKDHRKTSIHVPSVASKIIADKSLTISLKYYSKANNPRIRTKRKFTLEYFTYKNSLYTDSLEKQLLKEVRRIADNTRDL